MKRRRFSNEQVFAGRVHGLSCARLVMDSRALLLLGLLACTCAGCAQSTCVQPPCALPTAIVLSVTSAAGGPVPGVTVTISGSLSTQEPCTPGASATTCGVLGTAGTYNLLLSAAGFQDKALSVVVSGDTPACGCPTVQTQHVSTVLTPHP